MTDLSPAAQAVLDAYNAGFIRPVAVHHKPRIAAALRAAADHIDHDRTAFNYIDSLYEIADELEAQ